MAVSSATPLAASGSDSSSMEVTPAASAAGFSAQENPSSSLVAASAMGDGELSSLRPLIRRNCWMNLPSMDPVEKGIWH